MKVPLYLLPQVLSMPKPKKQCTLHSAPFFLIYSCSYFFLFKFINFSHANTTDGKTKSSFELTWSMQLSLICKKKPCKIVCSNVVIQLYNLRFNVAIQNFQGF